MMPIDYEVFRDCGGQPKGPSRKRLKGRKDRAQRKETGTVRAYVFARERNLCRICRLRPATSMHELRFRSLGGKVSRKNSVAVCGDGVQGCHGFAQRNEIEWSVSAEQGAEGTLWFQAMTERAAEWLRIKRLETIESPVMVETEIAL